MGYSDLTALLNAIHFKTGLITFHGPMGIENWNNLNGVYFENVLINGNLGGNHF
jgi:muramoyltetrapeptide carboxypeptidase